MENIALFKYINILYDIIFYLIKIQNHKILKNQISFFIIIWNFSSLKSLNFSLMNTKDIEYFLYPILP